MKDIKQNVNLWKDTPLSSDQNVRKPQWCIHSCNQSFSCSDFIRHHCDRITKHSYIRPWLGQVFVLYSLESFSWWLVEFGLVSFMLSSPILFLFFPLIFFFIFKIIIITIIIDPHLRAFLLILEREERREGEGEREKHQCERETLIGVCLLHKLQLGIKPATFWWMGQCSTNWATQPGLFIIFVFLLFLILFSQFSFFSLLNFLSQFLFSFFSYFKFFFIFFRIFLVSIVSIGIVNIVY